MKGGEIHLHHRKRIRYQNPSVRFLDNIVLVVAIITPLMTIPQIYKIFTLQDASGVSLLTWSLLLFLAFPFFIYGVVHKEKPIIVMYTLWIVVESLIVAGVLLYG